MRIAYIANTSIHSIKWIEYFINKGHEVAWFDIYHGNLPKHLLEKERGNDKLHFFNQASYSHTIELINNWFKPDIVHAHYAGWNGFIGALTNRHPYIITVWGSDVIGNYGNILKRQVVKYGLQRADLITTDAEHIMGWLARYGVKPDKIKRINFGVDTELFKPQKIAHKGKVVVSLRSLEKIYDVETLIRAVPYVVEEIDDVLFKIYGDGSQRAYLERLTSKLGVSDFVEFCGKVDYAEIPKVLNSADLYVSTALSDAGLSSSTAEAMACGLVCLTTDVADNYQWLGVTFGTQLFDKRDYKYLSKAIIAYLVDKHKQLGLINREKIVKEDNYLTEMGKMEHIYAECIDNSKS